MSLVCVSQYGKMKSAIIYIKCTAYTGLHSLQIIKKNTLLFHSISNSSAKRKITTRVSPASSLKSTQNQSQMLSRQRNWKNNKQGFKNTLKY